MTHSNSLICRLAVATLLLVGCASAPRAQRKAEPRLKDSAPEKVAAQRSAARGLQLEEEDQRWGTEAARARRQEAAQKKQLRDAAFPVPGPVDLAKPPASLPH